MTDIVRIPPMVVVVGEEFSRSLRLEDPTADDPVVDLTGYSATWSISEKPFDTAFSTGTAEIIDDRVVLSIPGATTALFTDYALPIIGGRPSAILQIDLAGPTAAQNLVLQASLTIAGTL